MLRSLLAFSVALLFPQDTVKDVPAQAFVFKGATLGMSLDAFRKQFAGDTYTVPFTHYEGRKKKTTYPVMSLRLIATIATWE
jgi:hypothetical protein